MICKNLVPLISFKSTKTVLLDSFDKEKPTIGFKRGYLYLDDLTNFCNVDALACPNWQFNFALNFPMCDLEDISIILTRTDLPQLLAGAVSTMAALFD